MVHTKSAPPRVRPRQRSPVRGELLAACGCAGTVWDMSTQPGSPFDPGSFSPPPPPKLTETRKGSRSPFGDPFRAPADDAQKRARAKKSKAADTSGQGRQGGEPGGFRSAVAAWRSASLLVKVVAPVAVGILVAVLVRMMFLETFTVPSASMTPTLQPGDRIAVEKFSYLLGTPHRGDVIVFRSGPGWDDVPSEKFFVKRVVGVAGDAVKCCDTHGRVLVNGSAQHEDYVVTGTKPVPFKTVVVPDGKLFVMGDNRDDSYDSRYRGPVSADQVVGRAAFKIWPLGRIGYTGRD